MYIYLCLHNTFITVCFWRDLSISCLSRVNIETEFVGEKSVGRGIERSEVKEWSKNKNLLTCRN